MKLEYGKLLFECGDILNIEDTAGKESLKAEKIHDCRLCEFYGICDESNPANTISRFCRNTHFIRLKKE